MMKSKTFFTGSVMVAGLLVAALAGCQHHETNNDVRVRGEAFRPEGEERTVAKFVTVQTAAGARTDATLRPYHFDCGDLNSLGQEKLDLMLRDDDACAPLVLYVDVPQDESTNARHDSIKVYLKDRGLTDAQIKLVEGSNPKNLNPAAPGIRALKLIESGAPVGVNPEPAGSPVNGQPAAH